MTLRLVSFGLAAAALLVAGAPTFAQSNDNASVQTGEINTIITGNGNNVRAEMQQTSDNNRGFRKGSTGVSQSGRLNTDIVGDGNRVDKIIRQRSVNKNQ